MKYSELHYERIDAKQWREHMNYLVDKFTEAQTADEEIDIIMNILKNIKFYKWKNGN